MICCTQATNQLQQVGSVLPYLNKCDSVMQDIIIDTLLFSCSQLSPESPDYLNQTSLKSELQSCPNFFPNLTNQEALWSDQSTVSNG